MANLVQYNAKDTAVMIDNFYVTGFGEDMISGAKDEEFSSQSVGCLGDVVDSEINNDLGTITMTIQGGSPQMKTLLEMARNRKMFSVWVTNKKIGERFGGSKAKFKNYPELAYGTELEDREFEIVVFDFIVEPC